MLFKIIFLFSIGLVTCRPHSNNQPDQENEKIEEIIPGRKFNKIDITYKISKYSSKLKENEIDAEIQRAFNEWSRVIPLKFTQTKQDKADIEIKFGTGDQGNGVSLDGPGKAVVLALPFEAIYIDDDEDLTIKSPSGSGIDLYTIVLHAVGNVLNLRHSTDRDSVMFPNYISSNSNRKLSTNDEKRIQAIYGRKE